MPGLAECQSLLRLLIAKGDPKAIPIAKGAIDQFLNTAPVSARGRGLRVLQRDALLARFCVHGKPAGLRFLHESLFSPRRQIIAYVQMLNK